MYWVVRRCGGVRLTITVPHPPTIHPHTYICPQNAPDPVRGEHQEAVAVRQRPLAHLRLRGHVGLQVPVPDRAGDRQNPLHAPAAPEDDLAPEVRDAPHLIFWCFVCPGGIGQDRTPGPGVGMAQTQNISTSIDNKPSTRALAHRGGSACGRETGARLGRLVGRGWRGSRRLCGLVSVDSFVWVDDVCTVCVSAYAHMHLHPHTHVPLAT